MTTFAITVGKGFVHVVDKIGSGNKIWFTILNPLILLLPGETEMVDINHKEDNLTIKQLLDQLDLQTEIFEGLTKFGHTLN